MSYREENGKTQHFKDYFWHFQTKEEADNYQYHPHGSRNLIDKKLPNGFIYHKCKDCGVELVSRLQ